MVYKNKEQDKEYHQRYFKNNKSKYADNKRLQYWRDRYCVLAGLTKEQFYAYGSIRDTLTENELKILCKELKD